MTSFVARAPWVGALIAGSAVLLVTRAASAQDCATDADCGAGLRCETITYEVCSGGGMCTPDGECTETEVVCEPYSYSTCTRAPCATDADCPSWMACHAQSYWVCDGGGAGRGGAGVGGSAGALAPDCDPAAGPCEDPPPPPEPSCTEEPGESVCTPRYELPCEIASDCGGGFDCLESSYWVCTGMGSAGAGGSAPPGPDPAGGGAMDPGAGEFECHEEPSGMFYCQLQELPCGADAECPDGLECQDQYIYLPCMGGEAGAMAAGAGGSAGSFGDMRPPPDSEPLECPPPIVEQRCAPPSYYGGGAGGMGAPPPGAGGGGSSSDAGVMDPEAPPSGYAGTGTGSTGSPGAAGQGGAGGGQADDDDESDEGHGRGHGRGHHFGWLRGCSAGGPISADLSWVAFGLIALVLRRRARG